MILLEILLFRFFSVYFCFNSTILRHNGVQFVIELIKLCWKL